MESMFRKMSIIGLSLLLCLSIAGVGYAQNEDSFVRAATVSKRDAVLLSALFPGLGQMTAGSKVKGVSMFLAETISLALFVNAHEDYTTKLDTYNRDKQILDSMAGLGRQSYTEANKLYMNVKRQNTKLDDLHNTRNIALAVAAGVYAYNLVDALFFTSSSTESQRAEMHRNITVQSVMVDKTPGIMISKSF